MKKLLGGFYLLLSVIFLSSNLYSQNYNMTNGNISTCSGTFYDNNGTGNYNNNQNLTYTICPSTPGSKIRVNFTTFSLDNGWDFLYIYDGNSTAAPSLGVYTGTNGPGITQATNSNTSGCLTFRFTSDAIVRDIGWVGAISCVLPCQTITSNFVSSNPPPQADGVIRICQGQSVTFNGSGTFSNNGVGSSYSWTFNGGSPQIGQSITNNFPTSGSYIVNLNITDANGCTNSNAINRLVQVSTTPTFTTSASPTTICQGQSANLTAGVTMTPFVQNCTPSVAGTTFLPDGSGLSYNTSIPVNCYGPTQTITSASDIQNICLNMEHSYLGDLQIRIVCPNGQSSILKAYPGGGGTYLGCALDDGSINPGTGLTYCFTPTASTLLVNGTTTTCGTPASATIAAGNYQPVQSFNNLVGCPLNGNWTIQVTDNIAADNGYIFNWDINFNVAPLLNTSFTPTIASQGWTATSGLTQNTATIATVTPTTTGSNCYQYSITDNFGCSYNTQQCITVTAGTTPTFTQLGPYCQNTPVGTLPITSNNGISGTWNPSTINNTTTTTYTFTPTAGQCAQSTTMTITINSAVTANVTGTNPICDNACNGTATATTLTGTGPFTYIWTPSGNTQTITGLCDGTYNVNIIDAFGCQTTGSVTLTDPVAPVLTPIGHD
jgi:subtilisin-like proprotein convertase family protein